MWAFAAIWFRKFGGWILAALSFLLMILTVGLMSKKVGKAEGKADAAVATAADREAVAVRQINEVREASTREVEAVKGANDVKANNAVLDDVAVNDKLRDNWTRD